MPFGLQLLGPLFGDGRLIAAASAIEQAFADDPTLARPRPDLTRLTTARPDLRSIVTHPPIFEGVTPVSKPLGSL